MIDATMNLRICKVRENAQPLVKAYDNPAGMDLTLVHLIKVEKGIAYFGTGWAVQPEDGYYTEIVPRSSLPKSGWHLANSVGIIDSDYRGELIVALTPTLDAFFSIHRSDVSVNNTVSVLAKSVPLPARFVQLIVRRKESFTVQEVDSLDDTQRSSGGFGSSG